MIGVDMSPFARALKLRLVENRVQIEQAAHSLVSRLAAVSVIETQAEMRRVFDRPTRATLNSLVAVDGLNKFTARILWRGDDASGKGVVTPSKWLRAEILGGARGQKASERRMQRSHGAAAGQTIYLVPTKYAPTDAYGNVPGPRMVKILSDIEALGGYGQGFDGNRQAGRRSRGKLKNEQYFAIWPPGHADLPPGIYQRFGRVGKGYVRPVFIFTRAAPAYAPRLDLVAVVRRTIATRAGELFLRSMRRERVFAGQDGASAMRVPNVRL